MVYQGQRRQVVTLVLPLPKCSLDACPGRSSSRVGLKPGAKISGLTRLRVCRSNLDTDEASHSLKSRHYDWTVILQALKSEI